jgi:hypothetical protein
MYEAQLKSLMRPPLNPVLPANLNWDAAAKLLEAPIPDDYRWLIETYGRGSFCDYLELLVPFANRSDLLDENKAEIIITWKQKLPGSGHKLFIAGDDDANMVFVRYDEDKIRYSIVYVSSDLIDIYESKHNIADFLYLLFSGTISLPMCVHLREKWSTSPGFVQYAI